MIIDGDGNGLLHFHGFPLLEGNVLGDGGERLRMATGLQHLQLAKHAPCFPSAFMLAPAYLGEQLRCGFCERAARNAPEDRFADDHGVFAT